MYDEDDYLAKTPESPMPYEIVDDYAALKADRNRWRSLCKDIVTVLGNNPYYLRNNMDSWIKKMCNCDEEERMQKFADDIIDRLLKIKPHEWEGLD